MPVGMRVFCVAACLFALTGCASSPSSPDFKLSSLFPGQDTPPPPPGSEMVSRPASATPDITGSTPAVEPNPAVQDALLGGDPGDDLVLGKRQYREKNYGL